MNTMTIRTHIHSITLASILSIPLMAQPLQRHSSQEQDVLNMAAHVKNARTSVVSIQSFNTHKDNTIQQRVGSGFIYDSMGLVVTLGSIIQGGDSILVTLEDGQAYYSNIVHYDKITDIIVLKMTKEGLQALPLGNASTLVPQSQLVILGNALGIFPSVTMSTFIGRGEDGMLRLTVMVAPGNSGSPVLDKHGRVVGILIGRVWEDKKKIHGTAGEGIAVPVDRIIDVVQPVIHSLDEGGGWVGITVLNLDDRIDFKGVRVTKVDARGPAQQAGISVGDTLILFEGQRILNSDQLAAWVRASSPNTKVAFTIQKADMEITYLIRVAAMPGLRRKRIQY
jgi:serine protease Do